MCSCIDIKFVLTPYVWCESAKCIYLCPPLPYHPRCGTERTNAYPDILTLAFLNESYRISLGQTATFIFRFCYLYNSEFRNFVNFDFYKSKFYFDILSTNFISIC